jgi:predicted enzyme related to lactoylglutathione lyase
MPSRIAVVAIDAVQPHLIADFWCSVLGWQVVEEDAEVISIAPSDGAWPTIDVLAVPERKTIKNRLHFDLRADGIATSQELERLLSLGARRVDVGQQLDVSWVVLSDPEGNEFCLLSRSVQEVQPYVQSCPVNDRPPGSQGQLAGVPGRVRAALGCWAGASARRSNHDHPEGPRPSLRDDPPRWNPHRSRSPSSRSLGGIVRRARS